jgi:hypothetical protein
MASNLSIFSLRKRKGMSPLIATALLISFAIAIGVVIMSFGRAQVGLEARCTIDIGLKFAEIGGENEICFDSSKETLSFIVENGVNTPIEGLVVNIIGSERVESFDLDDAKISKAGNYLTKVGFNVGANGEIRQIKILPKVKPFDEIEICSEQALTAENLKAC